MKAPWTPEVGSVWVNTWAEVHIAPGVTTSALLVFEPGEAELHDYGPMFELVKDDHWTVEHVFDGQDGHKIVLFHAKHQGCRVFCTSNWFARHVLFRVS